MSASEFDIRPAEPRDAGAIADIYNHAIHHTTATFDTIAKSADERLAWLASRDERHPVYVAETNGTVVGWAALNEWSNRPAYHATGETSVYVAEAFRGRGIGRRLKKRIIAEAKRLDYHTLIARTAEESAASIRLNESLGFRHIGTMKEVGYKFGRHLDVHIMQLMLGDAENRRTVVAEREAASLAPFLECTRVIDWQHPGIRALAAEFKGRTDNREALIRSTFEWVRDRVQHSLDFRRSELTCCASEVLERRTGYCYAKSHLLAALLRANGIPSGFCYQRLSLDGLGAPFCLHGLNAAELQRGQWRRLDARGNRDDVDAQFSPEREQLAFSANLEGELDFAEVWAAPLPFVIHSLETAPSVESLSTRLPDLTASDMEAARKASPIQPVTWTVP